MRLPPIGLRQLPHIGEVTLQSLQVDYRLWRHGVARTLALVETLAVSSEPPLPESLRKAREIGWLTAAICRRLPWRPRCLNQAITVAHCLGRRQLPFELRIGVRGGEPESFGAHAWLLVAESVVVGGDNTTDFVEIMTIRPAGR